MQAAYEIARALLGGEIDRGRRAFLAAEDGREIRRLPEPAARVAKQDDRGRAVTGRMGGQDMLDDMPE